MPQTSLQKKTLQRKTLPAVRGRAGEPRPAEHANARDSDLVQLHGYGGNASPFTNKTLYHAGFPGGRPENYIQSMPSLFRVQRSTRMCFANVMDEGRVTDEKKPSVFIAAGNETDPRSWNAIMQQDGEGVCDPNVTPGKCTATRVLDRPVVWEWSGKQ